MKKTNLSGCEAALSPEGHLSAAQRRLSRAAKRSALLIVCLLSALAGAAQKTGVSVSNFKSTPGAAATTVTFNVSWTSTVRDSVWVFVDYNTRGTMKRLPLTGATLTAPSQSGASISMAPGNPNGAWVVAPAAGSPFSATVQMSSATTYTYGSCAYAIPQPPKGEYEALDAIRFTGTPPFEVKFNESGAAVVPVEAAKPYAIPADRTIASFTDATQAPGVFKYKAPTVSTQPAAQTFCEAVATPTLTVAIDVGSHRDLTYQWKTGAGINAPGVANRAGYTPTVTATSDFWVVVTNGHALSATSGVATITIKGNSAGRLDHPGACTPGAGILGYTGM